MIVEFRVRMKLSHFKVQLVIRLTMLFAALLLLAFGIANEVRSSLLVVLGAVKP